MSATEIDVARDWLRRSDPDREHADRWLRQARFVLLPLGYKWAALKVPEVPGKAVLEVGVRGPVLHHPQVCFYFLVPKETGSSWDFPGTECLGEGSWLTVPVPEVTEPPGIHWVQMPSGGLVDPDDLHAVLSAGATTWR
ncbi:hypothetical protein [Streptomyces triculaminicus]|uniref:hypothetical protein n=1 Tax=Streptomyces triculaminicus TaxID=2816232 RepID=UPI0037B3DF13